MDFLTKINPILSLISAVLSIISIFFAIWVFFKQKKTQEEIHDFTNKALSDLKKAQETAQQFQNDSFRVLVELRNDNLRLLYDFYNQAASQQKAFIATVKNIKELPEFSDLNIERLENIHEYWHFKSRFETFDSLGLQLNKSDYHIKVRILGTTKNFRNLNIDSLDIEYYICEIIEIPSKPNDLFEVSEKIACFFHNKSSYLSKYASNTPVEPVEKYKFIIAGLGSNYIGSGRIQPAKEIKYYKRIKNHAP